MQERTERLGPATRRLQGVVGGTTFFGAIGIVLMMAMAPATASGVRPALFHGATWAPTTEDFSSSCASGKLSAKVAFHPSTGIGHFDSATSNAKSCTNAGLGGSKANSENAGEAQLYTTVPVKLNASSAGVSEAWNVKASGTTKATFSGATPTCTPTYTNDSYNYGYTWYNFSEAYALCDVEAEDVIIGFAYLLDATTNSYVAYDFTYDSFFTPIVANASGDQVNWYAYHVSYSNSSYWAYNSTYSSGSGYNFTWGSPGGFSGTYTPVFYLNGTFTTGDKYTVESYLICEAFTEVYNWGHATATATYDGSSIGDHVDLVSVTSY
jgi:hypothetical protein